MDLIDMKIDWNYELPTQLRALLGAEYIRVYTQYSTLHFGEYISAYISFPVRLIPQYYYFDDREYIVLEMHSKGMESVAGDLYGIVVNTLEPKYAEQTSAPYFSNIAIYGPVNKIVGLGEVRDEVLVVDKQEDDLGCFFSQNDVLPNAITIKKKTLEVIGFGLTSGKWLYLFSGGEGSFSLRINEFMSPEELCRHQDYLAMERDIRILEVFE